MKKLLLLSMLALTLQFATAQDFKKVQNAFLLGRVEEAKTELDKVMADPKAQGKAEAYFWKAKIYASLFKDANMRSKYPDAGKEAGTAIKKYEELDPQFAQVKEKGADPYFDMYSVYFQQGVKVFNEKKWEEAGQAFTDALYYIDEIINNKWANANVSFDTTSILYAGYAYQNAGKPDLATKFYIRLAENKVNEKVYFDVYRFLLEHYTKANDEAAFNKFLALSRTVYPSKEDEETWEAYEIDFMDKNYDLAKKTSIYDKGHAAGTLSENKYLQYGDMFVKAKNDDKLDSAQAISYTLKAAEAFKNAYLKNNQNAIAAFNVGVIFYNIFGEYDDKVRDNIRKLQTLNSDRPVEKDPKKKAAADAKFKELTEPIRKANIDLEKPINENLETALEWLEKSFVILKDKTNKSNIEKSVTSKAVDFLANIYAYKRDKVRGKDTKAFDAFDAKFKEFDNLHGKF